ncbi:gp114 [Erwinia phage vB_EamP-S6]|uniref:Gp114 n=1 Tax=Erwinia phage vB_EamP-S6 TaxID=1051675 RepID=G0YQK6_9CAUD|nr:gp114 [Erwinia phage vB_EamP-S6]AEJ81633.1 gp114 [Erwinia phage vB_EamP-S6]
MTLCELLNQELPLETKRQSTLTGIFYWSHQELRRRTWQEVRGAKAILEHITNMPYYRPS